MSLLHLNKENKKILSAATETDWAASDSQRTADYPNPSESWYQEDSMAAFRSLGVSQEILRSLEEMGFNQPTPIQKQSIPYVLAGLDVIGQAQTGTGKTCAYGIPAIQLCEPDVRGARTLVLCPTRELAIQVADELRKVCKYTPGVRIAAVYGGQHIETQIINLRKKPQIIIGTPGRIMDHLRRRTLKLNDLNMIVLDEADEMLRMGFREDIDIILESAPEYRQMLLFSATMPEEILAITNKYQHNPVNVEVERKEMTVELIEQRYIEVRESSKAELLCRLIDLDNIPLGLVFCNTKRRVDNVTAQLQARGYSADALHGDMKQHERDRVMNKFRNGLIRVLVATDVAARGIDVSGVGVVYNYDIPEDPEQYVHRIGRTGRAGKAGISYSFVFGRDIYKLRDIMRYTRSEMTRVSPPTLDQILTTRTAAASQRTRERALQGAGSQYISVIQEMLASSQEAGEDLSLEQLAATLFHMAHTELEERDYQHADFDEAELDYEGLDMVRLFVTAGRMDKLTEGDLVKAVASQSRVTGRELGTIELHTNFSFIDVPREYVEDVLESMEGFVFNGRVIRFEVADKKGRKTGSRGRKKSRHEKRGRNLSDRDGFGGSDAFGGSGHHYFDDSDRESKRNKRHGRKKSGDAGERQGWHILEASGDSDDYKKTKNADKKDKHDKRDKSDKHDKRDKSDKHDKRDKSDKKHRSSHRDSDRHSKHGGRSDRKGRMDRKASMTAGKRGSSKKGRRK